MKLMKRGLVVNNQEKKDLAKEWAITAKFYDKEFTYDMMQIMVEDVSHLTFDETKKALSTFRKESKNKTWPRPADIISICAPQMSKETIANEAASRIRAAISKFGWCNGLEAQKFIGDLGWKIVERAGGWAYICENHGLDLNPLTFHAQARDLAKSMIESKEHGVFDQPVQIEKTELKLLVNNMIKEIPK